MRKLIDYGGFTTLPGLRVLEANTREQLAATSAQYRNTELAARADEIAKVQRRLAGQLSPGVTPFSSRGVTLK